jgi:predicted AlkP superfamily pyrophosphatase or phosphodiesterase
MKNKVILISIDGMRPDGMQQCDNPYVKELEKICAYTYKASSMNPSVTFPCHFSMTHSVTPQRHGILSNTYVPQVRPVKGIFEKIEAEGGVSAMFYGWEPLRDIALPGTLTYATYINAYAKESSDTVLADAAIQTIEEVAPDFVFLYMVETDEKGGHDNGWMSAEYLRRISIAIDNVKRVIEKFGDRYSVILMADHGGHERSHGTEMAEDMTIPLFFYGKDFAPGEIEKPLSLLNVAPTIAHLMGISPEKEWEGVSVLL